MAGAALLGIAIWRIRAPLARAGELDRLAENARRYDSWRGGRTSAGAGSETTGADVMRQLLRRRVFMWSVAAGLGIALLAAGFAIR